MSPEAEALAMLRGQLIEIRFPAQPSWSLDWRRWPWLLSAAVLADAP